MEASIAAAFLITCVKQQINHHSIVHLQRKLLGELSPRTEEISDSESGIKAIRDVVKNKKVLIILDDLDQRNQFDSLAGRDFAWFDSGSRIIMTTRDPRCVAKLPTVRDYSMSEMSLDHALQLFRRHAFKMESTPTDYLRISKKGHCCVWTTSSGSRSLRFISSPYRQGALGIQDRDDNFA